MYIYNYDKLFMIHARILAELPVTEEEQAIYDEYLLEIKNNMELVNNDQNN